MKRLLIAAAFATIPAITVADGASGCGWGALLFDGNNGLASHVFGVTTNNTFGNNTFGMSSGTNGCTVHNSIRYQGARFVVGGNMDRLASDISRGEGEVLTALAVVLEIKEYDRPLFYKLMQKNFEKIYPDESVTSDDVMAALVGLIQNDNTLTKYQI